MRKIVSGIVLIASTVLFAQDAFNLQSLFYKAQGDTNQYNTSTGARGVITGSDLDQDGRPEILTKL